MQHSDSSRRASEQNPKADLSFWQVGYNRVARIGDFGRLRKRVGGTGNRGAK